MDEPLGERDETVSCCWIGGARYRDPLDPTSEKKFAALSRLGGLFVIGFSWGLVPRRFTRHARFYLLPLAPFAPLRYAEMVLVAPLIALLLIVRRNVSILVAQSPYEAAAAVAAKWIAGFFRYRVAVVVESHNDFEEVLFVQRRVFFAGMYRYIMRRAARFSLKHADVLRPVSNTTRDQLVRWAPEKPLFQFMAWTDMEAFLSADRMTRTSRQPVVLYAGVLTPGKGVGHLVNAFARCVKDCPGARLVLVGRDENRTYAAQLRGRVAQLGLNDSVDFVKEMPQTALAGNMARARVFVLPSLSEALGRVVVEAMATGTPVIGSRVGGIPEIIEDGATGFLVPPADEDALEEKIRWMLTHPEEAREMGRKARCFAASFFSTDAYVGGYQRIFTEAGNVLSRGG